MIGIGYLGRASILAMAITGGFVANGPAFAIDPSSVITEYGIFPPAVVNDRDIQSSLGGLAAIGVYAGYDPEVNPPAPYFDEDMIVVGGDASVTNSGDLTTVGLGSPGILANALAGSVLIENSGNISVNGTFSWDEPYFGPSTAGISASTGFLYREHGIEEPLLDADGNPVLDDGGNPITIWHEGREVVTPGGDITISNTGAISVAGGNDNFGIIASTIAGGITITNGEEGDGSVGAITHTGSWDDNGGGDSAAIAALSSSGDITITNHADVSVADTAAIGAIAGVRPGSMGQDLAAGGGKVTVTNTGNLSLGVGEGANESGSHRLMGIGAISTGSSGVEINNSGDITSTGWIDTAIAAVSGLISWEREESGPTIVEGGDVKVTNSGDINVKSGGSSYESSEMASGSGIRATAIGGGITVDNTGAISVTGGAPAYAKGYESSGFAAISASSGYFDQRYEPIEVPIFDENGEQVFDDNGEPIYDYEWVPLPPTIVDGGGITITNKGTIATAGGNGNFGILAKTQSAGVDITNGQSGSKTVGAITQTSSTEGYGSGDGAAIAGLSRAGDVTIVNYANLTVADNAAIGGVSGMAGSSIYDLVPGGGDVSITNKGDIKLGFGEGADPAGSSNLLGIGAISTGGAVEINNSGKIESKGFVDAAIDAVSGLWYWGEEGDGEGIFAGGDVKVTNSGDINVKSGWSGEPYDSERGDGIGIRAEALGGANVEVINSGNISAGETAIEADAEFGGSVKVTNTGTLSITDNGGDIISAEAADGGSVTVQNDGNLSTASKYSAGIGGEAGSWYEEELKTATILAPSVTVKGSGDIAMSGLGSSGINVNTDGGKTTVDYSGDITVSGNNSAGIIASASDEVSVKVSGNVIASGADSYGVFVAPGGEKDVPKFSVDVAAGAKVQGGTGGRDFGFVAPSEDEDADEMFKGSAGVILIGSASNIITNSGTITGLNGLAINAFEGNLTFMEERENCVSVGDGGVDCTYENVEVVQAFRAGDTEIKNRLSGNIAGDIKTGSGRDTLTNEGTVSGNIDLGGGVNGITNAESGVINSFDLINVGANNTFTNSGILNPGGIGKTQETTVVGNFVQSAKGRLLVDIDDTAKLTSDRLSVSGAAKLAGTVVPNIVAMRASGSSEYLIVKSAGGATNNGLAVNPASLNVRDTVGFDFGLDFRGANDVYLTAEAQTVDKIVEAAVDAAVDDGSVGNKGNIIAVGKTLEAIENQDLEALRPLIEALRIEATTPEAAAKALNRLIPQNQPAQTSNTAKSSLTLGNAMFSCAERDGEYAYTREGKCYYARIGARRLDRDATGAGAGVEETAYEVLGGAQVALWDQVRLGFALGYEDLSADTYDQAQALGTSDGDRFNFGLVLKNQWGPINAYLNLAGSYTGYDHTRFVGLGNGMDRATGEQDVWSQTTRVRFSYLNDLGPWYWKPMIDLAATYVDMESYTERGAGAANLRVASSDEWLLSVMPGMEVGGEVRSTDGTIWRPYARAGVIVFDDNETSVTANFAAAPAGLIPFEVSGEFDQVMADVEAGVIVLTTSGINMKLNYEGRYGEDSQQHGGGLKITAPY